MNNFDTVRVGLAVAIDAEEFVDKPVRKALLQALTALAQIEADHYSAADMASAAAQGFRDGVASVTAGQKPVKWMCTETKVLYDHDTSEVDKYHGFKPTVPLYAAPAAQQPQAEAVTEMHDALCPALTGGDCTCTPPAIIDKAWAQFCGGIGRGPDAPYPGMIESFEAHYGQVFTDKDWREETGVWAAAWKAAKAHGEAAPQQAEAVPDGWYITERRDGASKQWPITEQQALGIALSQQAEAVPSDVTDAMVDAYLQANDAYWRETDAQPKSPVKWRNGNPKEATRVSLAAAIAAAAAQGEKP